MGVASYKCMHVRVEKSRMVQKEEIFCFGGENIVCLSE